ncbi:MAG TPA: hypothetical protein VNX68_10725 [Nitrosopumilaceae archaeon]|jgi:hypothetical protein|nr:hypothetical protein [Nitrosopumilaceae archaeon]
MHEQYTKRTIFIAKCTTCPFEDSKLENPPRETMCFNCKKWVPYVEQSYIGPELVK